MAQFERRSDERKKACVQVFASDLADAMDVKCVVRDVNSSGCKIVSTQIRELPELIQLVPEGFDKPIRGKIVWRDRNMAGVCFEHACSDEARARIEALCHSLQEVQGEDVLDLGCEHEPLSYSDRLKRYQPSTK